MRKLVVIAAAAAWLCSAPSLLAASLGVPFGKGATQVGLHGGTLGVGMNAGYDFSKDIAIRGLVNYLSMDFDEKRAGNRYSGDLDMRSVGLVLDWHPFWGAFRVSGGAFLNGDQIKASTQGVTLGIGGGTYDADLSFRMEFDRTAPYLGIGWTTGRERSGLSISADVGALFRGSTRVSASGQAQGCGFTVSRDGSADVDCEGVPGVVAEELGDDLEQEHRELRGALDSLKIYPVISLGLSYRF